MSCPAFTDSMSARTISFTKLYTGELILIKRQTSKSTFFFQFNSFCAFDGSPNYTISAIKKIKATHQEFDFRWSIIAWIDSNADSASFRVLSHLLLTRPFPSRSKSNKPHLLVLTWSSHQLLWTTFPQTLAQCAFHRWREQSRLVVFVATWATFPTPTWTFISSNKTIITQHISTNKPPRNPLHDPNHV